MSNQTCHRINLKPKNYITKSTLFGQKCDLVAFESYRGLLILMAKFVSRIEKLRGALTFTTLWAYSADDNVVTFSPQKTGFDISCKLSP